MTHLVQRMALTERTSTAELVRALTEVWEAQFKVQRAQKLKRVLFKRQRRMSSKGGRLSCPLGKEEGEKAWEGWCAAAFAIPCAMICAHTPSGGGAALQIDQSAVSMVSVTCQFKLAQRGHDGIGLLVVLLSGKT